MKKERVAVRCDNCGWDLRTNILDILKKHRRELRAAQIATSIGPSIPVSMVREELSRMRADGVVQFRQGNGWNRKPPGAYYYKITAPAGRRAN